MKRILVPVFYVFIVVLVSACQNAPLTPSAISPTESASPLEPTPSDSSADNLSEKTDIPKHSAEVDKTDAYLKYMKEHNKEIADMDILFFEQKDIDNDGYIEIIAAFGDKDEEYDDWNWIRESFILCDKEGKIELISQGFANGGGYACYKAELVRFDGADEDYILIGITNGGALHGIEIIKVSGGDIINLAYDASATGAGNAYLSDKNGDGVFDGYISERWSYDVLYYEVSSYYAFKDGRFDHMETHVNTGDYPKTVKDVVTQYISLCVLSDFYPSDDITKRINELRITSEKTETQIKAEQWYSGFYEFILGIDSSISMDIDESGNIASVTVNKVDEHNKKEYSLSFELSNDNGVWHIISIADF